MSRLAHVLTHLSEQLERSRGNSGIAAEYAEALVMLESYVTVADGPVPGTEAISLADGTTISGQTVAPVTGWTWDHCRSLMALQLELDPSIWNDAIRPVVTKIAEGLRAAGSLPPNESQDHTPVLMRVNGEEVHRDPYIPLPPTEDPTDG